MVRVTFQEGPHAAMTLEAGPLVTPQDILCGLSQYKYRWETDLTDATDAEKALWSSQDLSVRMVRALASGRSVRVDDKTYQGQGVEGAFTMAAAIEEDILESGQTAELVSDDERGVTIVTR